MIVLYFCFDMLLMIFCFVFLVVMVIWVKCKNIIIGGIVVDKNVLLFVFYCMGLVIERGIEKLWKIVVDEVDVIFILNVIIEFCVVDMVGVIVVEMYYKYKVFVFIGLGMCYV